MPVQLLPLLLILAPLPARQGEERAAPPGDTSGRAEAAIVAIRAGDYARARGLLGEIVVRQGLERGRQLMAAGSPREAMAAFDEVLEVEPRNAGALLERGRAACEAAQVDPRNAPFFFEDALATFERSWSSGGSVEALLEASRAARQAGRGQKSLELALEAMRVIEASPEARQIGLVPERVVAEASFSRYVEQRGAQQDTGELFGLTEDYLQRVLGRTPADPWPWLQLVDLYQLEGALESASRCAKQGLDERPEHQELHERLRSVARELGGRERVLEDYREFIARFPSVALGHWHAGHETLLLGCDRLREGQDARGSFRVAQSHFQRAGEVDPSLAEACREYQAACRAGLGWAERAQGELHAAKAAFLSMEDVLEGGLTRDFPPDLASGVEGLRELVDDYYAGREEDPDAVGNAVKIYDFLHAYAPEVAEFAGSAGFFNRDLAVLLEQQAVTVLAESRDDPDPNRRAAAERRARGLRARAYELMQRSWAAYQDAARLAPGDARTQNEAGLIMAYYLRSDVRAAETYFQRAIELARSQLADEAQLAELPESVREDLPRAWGDACQNMGVLCLTSKHDPRRALEWFEQALSIGGVERPDVTEAWIPASRRALAGEPDAMARVAGEVWLPGER